MSFAATFLHPADEADQQAGDGQYYRRVLHELIDMGMDVARTVHQRDTRPAVPGGDGATAAVHEVGAAFDRIARAVRRTVALARRIEEPLPAREAAGQDRAAARRRIIREVEDVIQRSADGGEAEALGAELRERLDAPELEDEIGHRPAAEIIADICRDLGIAAQFGTRPWTRRTPRDVEVLCARAAQPRAARALVPAPVADAPSGRSEAGADPPSPPRDAGAGLLRFVPPVHDP